MPIVDTDSIIDSKRKADDHQDVSGGTIRAIPIPSAAARLGSVPIRMLNASGGPRAGGEGARDGADLDPSKKAAPRDAIHLLDKPGVATLVRLLFFPQMNAKQTALHKVLANLARTQRHAPSC